MSKRAISTVTTTLVAASLFVLGLECNARAGEECSEATLEGEYIGLGRGDAPIGAADPTFPRVGIAVYTFDGQGNVTILLTVSNGGQITRRQVSVGTYTLNSDCTGTTTSEDGAEWDIFFTRDGQEGVSVRVNAGFIATRTFKKR